MNLAATRVRLVEVGPRDGLQNEPASLPADVKVELIRRLVAAGLPAIEVGAFVRPDRVPQMADSGEVARVLAADGANVELWGLVPNFRGLQRAVASGLTHVALFTAASDAFSQANTGCTVRESLETLRPVIAGAKAQGVVLRGYVSTAFWCPFAGRVAPEQAEQVVAWLRDEGCDELVVADTVGAATPADVERLLASLMRTTPASRLGVHFHDTRGTALANVLVSLQLGVTTIDGAVGGLGGCPFAPGAQGNLATEDLLFMLDGLGIVTGVDVAAVRETSLWLQPQLGRALPSRYLMAGPPVSEPLGREG